MKDPNYLERSLEREREARRTAEMLLEKKSKELYLAQEKLKEKYSLALQHSRKMELFLSMTHLFHEPLEFNEQLRYFITAICELTGWPVGHVYLSSPERSNEIYSTKIWYLQDDNKFLDFRKDTEDTTFFLGIDLPGKVFANGEAVWIQDITMEPDFVRKGSAEIDNLKGGFAVPIIIEEKVVAVAEFFFPSIAKEDLYLFQVVEDAAAHIASIIGMQKKNYEYQQQLKYQITHDSLTQLPNRILLMDRLEQAISHASRNKKKVVVIFIDLDHFKNVNDGLGHKVGDELLIMVAKRLRNVLRSSDTLARLSGDEFVLLMPDPDTIHSIPAILTRLLNNIAMPYMIADQEINITCSLGFSVFPDDSRDPSTLIKNADAAMYQAKESGRNTFQFFTKEMHRMITERLELESGLRNALKRNELSLEYQPKLSFVTNQIVGVEALLRWNHPKLGIVSPSVFIPIANEIGIIVAIGEWVLKTACAQNKAWQDAGLPPMVISVNIAPRQFIQRNFVEMIEKILHESKLPSQYLELELTESLAMQNPEQFISILHAIKNLGVKLSIDDFGTGYSSLSYLRQFPLDWLKIDRSFVERLLTEKEGASVIQAIISLGHHLNMKVIAEGVETIEQFKNLKNLHCDEMQGYYISRPVSSEEFYKLLSEKKFPPTS